MSLGRNIVKARESKGLRQVDLAKKLRISSVRLCCWEKDEHAPRIDMLQRLAKELGVSAEFLLTGRR